MVEQRENSLARLAGHVALGDGESCHERSERERDAKELRRDAGQEQTCGYRDQEEEIVLALEAAQEPGQHQRRGRSENDESDHAQGGAEWRAASQSDNDQQDER